MGTTKHEPTVQDLQEFVNETYVTFASQVGGGKKKSLVVNLRGGFEVYSNGVKVHEGMQPFQAIEEYNSI